MAIRDILVHLESGDRCRQCVQAAAALAQRKQARLVGLAFELESSMLQYFGSRLAPDLLKSESAAAAEAAREAVATFEQIAGECGVSFESHLVSATPMEVDEKIAFFGRHVDMIFLEQPSPDRKDRNLMATLLEGALFNTGRPVYIVPYVGRRETPVRKAVIAWDGGYKAARAVNDAIPLLQDRGETMVLVVDPERRERAHGPQPGKDIADHLSRHGVNARVDVVVSGGLETSATILNYISDAGADLLVMGAYGHSRFRERTFGGVTHAILGQMTVPVLMSN